MTDQAGLTSHHKIHDFVASTDDHLMFLQAEGGRVFSLDDDDNFIQVSKNMKKL